MALRARIVLGALVALALLGGAALVGRSALPPPTPGPAPPPDPRAAAEQVQERIRTSVQALVPDARHVDARITDVDVVARGSRIGEVTVDFYDGAGPSATVLVSVTVAAQGAPVPFPCPGVLRCEERPLGDGTDVQLVEVPPSEQEAGWGQRARMARYFGADLAPVVVTSFDRVVGVTDRPPRFALTDDQLVAVATDPALFLALPVEPVAPPGPPTEEPGTTDAPVAGPAADALRRHVAAAFPAVAPAAADVAVEAEPGSGSAWVDVRFRDVHGTASVQLYVSQERLDGPAPVCPVRPPCGRRALPDGSEVVLDREASGYDADGTQVAEHRRVDGTTVTAAAFPYTDEGTRRPLPLTDDQLIALATDPELVLPG